MCRFINLFLYLLDFLTIRPHHICTIPGDDIFYCHYIIIITIIIITITIVFLLSRVSNASGFVYSTYNLNYTAIV